MCGGRSKLEQIEKIMQKLQQQAQQVTKRILELQGMQEYIENQKEEDV